MKKVILVGIAGATLFCNVAFASDGIGSSSSSTYYRSNTCGSSTCSSGGQNIIDQRNACYEQVREERTERQREADQQFNDEVHQAYQDLQSQLRAIDNQYSCIQYGDPNYYQSRRDYAAAKRAAQHEYQQAYLSASQERRNASAEINADASDGFRQCNSQYRYY